MRRMSPPRSKKSGAARRPRALPVELSAYTKQAKAMPQAEFSSRFAQPFLVLARTRSLVEAVTNAQRQDFESDSTAISTLEMVESPLAYVCPLNPRAKPIEGAVITLGRNPENDVMLPVPSVSGVHLQFMSPVQQGAAWLARDLGSKNGTFLDGQRMIPGQPYELRNGAQVEIARDVSGSFWESAELWRLLQDPSRLRQLLQQRPAKPADDW